MFRLNTQLLTVIDIRYLKPFSLKLKGDKRIKPRTNGRNIVGQQLPAFLDVTCCARLLTLLHVVVRFWELLWRAVKLLATCRRTQQGPTLLGQQCWQGSCRITDASVCTLL